MKMSLKTKVYFGCLATFFGTVIIISNYDLLSPCRMCLFRQLKRDNTSPDLYSLALYKQSVLQDDSIYDYSIERERTVAFLESVSLSLTHYKSRLGFYAVFTEPKAAVCMILKNGHSVIQFTSCLLTLKEEGDNEKFKKLESLSTFDGAFVGTCMQKARKRKIDNATDERLVFVRDPFERFISGWLFLCKRDKVCFNCGLDFGCFLKTLYMCWKTKKKYAKICNYKSPSPESMHNTSGYLYAHMYPQVASCDLLKRRKDFKVIEYSTENINSFLLSAARPLLSGQEYENLKGRVQQKTLHAADDHDAEELEALIRSSRTYVSMFAELYYMDYKIFDIAIPRFIVDYKLYENQN